MLARTLLSSSVLKWLFNSICRIKRIQLLITTEWLVNCNDKIKITRIKVDI